MTQRWLVAVALLVGCGGSTGRPELITAEMQASYDKYVTAFESVANDLGAPGMSCAKALGVVKNHAGQLASLLAFNGTTVKSTLAAAAKDPASRTWLSETYGSRLSASAGKVAMVTTLCKDEIAFKIAIASLMAQFPMLKK